MAQGKTDRPREYRTLMDIGADLGMLTQTPGQPFGGDALAQLPAHDGSRFGGDLYVPARHSPPCEHARQALFQPGRITNDGNFVPLEVNNTRYHGKTTTEHTEGLQEITCVR